jgi:hypothetical protein
MELHHDRVKEYQIDTAVANDLLQARSKKSGPMNAIGKTRGDFMPEGSLLLCS